MISDLDSVLVVDLDGTLLKSDLLYESLWSALNRNLLAPFRAIPSLMRGKAVFKSYLVSQAHIDPALLPYDDAVIAYVRDHRARGGRTVLATASNVTLAQSIARYLGLFDEVHASDETRNLKGLTKADFLVARFGAGGFAYAGDAAADLPVWQVSERIITVNAARAVRSKAECLGKPVEHLITRAEGAGPFLAALRPHQWLKNLLVFLPLLASHGFDTPTLVYSLLAFVAFCLTASSVYVVNDLMDLEADRQHPRKRFRPLASGALDISQGSFLAIALFALGMAVSGFLGWTFLGAMVVYYLLSTAYSLSLKRRAILDICILAGLYTLRIVAGAVASGIVLSVWLLAFSIFFFFSLAAVKRQAELVDMAERKVLTAMGRSYHLNDLPIISMIALAAGYMSVLVMALYVNSPSVVELYNYPPALWGICCVLLYWLTRMVLITHRGEMHDDPVVFAVHDRVSQGALVAVVGFAVLGAVL